MKFRKDASHILIVLLAFGIAVILWLMLFSRIDTDEQHFYSPFWSYRVLAQGMYNLLVLMLDPRYIGQSDVNVIYNSDGTILIEGNAKNRAWIQIARFSHSLGHYYMVVFSGLQKNKVGL